MSLATSGGIGGAGGGATGGLVLGHQAGGVARPAPPPPTGGDTGYQAQPPPAAVLGADLYEKNQAISLKTVRKVSAYPIVAVDLFSGQDPHVAYFPPHPTDPAETTYPRLVGKMKDRLFFHATEASHKTLRKYLAKSKTYESLATDSLAKSSDKDTVVLEHPEKWLGLRRLQDAPEFCRAKVSCEEETTPAISEESSNEKGTTWVNSTLDGSQPQNDDFDRVVAKVRLHPAKKALTILPEEGVNLLFRQAQYHVASAFKVNQSNDDGEEFTPDDVESFPCAAAVPAWYAHDAATEALFDAMDSAGTLFPRSLCALAGTLILPPDGKPNAVLERLLNVRNALGKEFQRKKVEDPSAVFEDEMLLLLFGMTDEGVECTAVQVSSVQKELQTCLFGDFKVLSNVSYQGSDALARLSDCCRDLEAALESVAPEADGPAGIVTYGASADQEKLKSKWEEIKKSQNAEWKKVPIFNSKADCVSTGCAMLGAVAHGRQLVVEGHKAKLGIRVQNVAPVAIGVRVNYFGDDKAKGAKLPIKTVFDFDRRIPAGPYQIELKASECIVHRSPGADKLSDDDFIKAAKENEKAKHIPAREAAALALKVEVYQKWTRDGEWKPVGDPIEPLVQLDADEKRIGCESVTFEISVGTTGLITTNLNGERESVVQATKTARYNKLTYYGGLALAILFFGGFFFKSYWDEYSFNRDTTKLLAYYKHVVPDSIADGDLNSARHIVWKHRHNRKRLWEKLEKKYGVPVREAHEWGDYDDGKGESVEGEEEEHEDLDEKDSEDEEAATGDEL